MYLSKCACVCCIPRLLVYMRVLARAWVYAYKCVNTLVYACICLRVRESVGQAAEMCIGKVHVNHESESLPAYLQCCPWPVCIVRGCRATELESNIKRRACQRAPLQKKYAGYAVSSAACAVLRDRLLLLLSLMYLHNFMGKLQLAAQAFKWQWIYIWPQIVWKLLFEFRFGRTQDASTAAKATGLLRAGN